jgi:hypothetical protein
MCKTPLDVGPSSPGGDTVTEVMWGPLRPSLHLGQPLPRLLERRVDLEHALDSSAGHGLDLLRLAAFDRRGRGGWLAGPPTAA